MANCIAKCTGIDGTRRKDAQRLGSRAAQAEARTWRTLATVHVRADGSGEVRVTQNDKVIHQFEWGPENAPEMPPPPEHPAEGDEGND